MINCLLFVLLLLPVTGLASDLAGMIDAARQGGAYQAPTAVELRAAEPLFERTLRGGDAKLGKDWLSIDMNLTEVRQGGEDFWLLREQSARTGRGIYLLRRAPTLPLAWQAPHSFKDLDTDQLALMLMLQGGRAATWNTVPRYGENGDRTDADLAHLAESYLAAFSRAFARVYPQGTVIQLHGFTPASRTSVAGQGADLILSAGHHFPGYRLRQAAACLAGRLPGGVLLYPDQVRELGGTTNQVGALLRRAGFADFIHMELSAALRRRLLDSAGLRDDFFACLRGSEQ